jgi:hypothetical protein
MIPSSSPLNTLSFCVEWATRGAGNSQGECVVTMVSVVVEEEEEGLV